MPLGEFERRIRYRQIPAHLGLLQAERFEKTRHRIEHVLAAARSDATVDEQSMQIFRARGVIADAQRRADEGADRIRAQRNLHVQQRVEAARGELRAQFVERAPALALVENEELDTGQIANQFVFEFADDPGQFRVGCLRLQRTHDRHHMRDIAECRRAQQADRLRSARHRKGDIGHQAC